VATMPVTGLVDVRSLSGPVTDSAASATAYATGAGTRNKTVGMDGDGAARCNLLELARAAGWATGVVTTATILDATPASFLAHVPTRSNSRLVARHIAESGVSVLLGGGREAFAPPDGCPECLDALRGKAHLLEDGRALEAVTSKRDRRPVIGLFAQSSLALAAKQDPSLAKMTAAALTLLEQRGPSFVLIVEGALTDDLSHQRAPLELLQAELRAFDAAIVRALEFQKRHPDTLVLVVSDHETGGLALLPNAEGGGVKAHYAPPPPGKDAEHTAQWIPLFASGPGAEEFSGLRTNAEVGRMLMRRLPAAAKAPPGCR
jgi:alkaline phosphatase